MSWISAIGSIFSWVAGESIAASLVRTAIGLGVMSYLNKSTSKGATSPSSLTPQGVRQQIPPSTENKIPVVYGDAHLGGTIIDVRLENNNKELYAVLAICEETGDIFSTNVNNPAGRTASSITIDNIFINNSRITFRADGTTVDFVTDETGVIDRNPSGLLGIYLYQGSSNDPMLPRNPITGNPIPGTVPPAAYEIMPGWTPAHRADNTIFAIVKLNYDPSKGLTTIPNLKFRVRNTLNKPGDVLHDYATNAIYGAGLDEAVIDNAGIVALNTYSDQTVTYPGHPSQVRYRINGVVRTTEPVLSNMQEIAASAGSFITYDISTGKWSTVISRVTAQTISFDDSNIIGNIAISGTALENFYNSVEVQFPYGFLRDQSNFVNIDLPQNIRNLNEEDNELSLNYELVNNVVQAHVLGNIELRQSREDVSVTFKTDYSKYNVQIGDVFGLTNSVYGWTDKKFRVIRVKKNESDEGELTVEITGLSYNDSIYTVEPISNFVPSIGPGQSIPNLGAIATPVAPTATTVTFNSQPNILISGVIPQGVVTEMEFWYAKDPETTVYTLLGSTRNENGGVFEVGALTAFKTVLLNSGTYRFKVRAVNASGSSQFSPASSPVDYVYTQAPDVLPYSVPAVDANGNTLDDAGQALNLGLLAFYVASKLNWGGILSQGIEVLADLFGLDPSIVETVEDLVASETPLVIEDEGTLLTDKVKKLNFTGAGVTATQTNGNVTVNIPAAAGGAITVRDEGTVLSTSVNNINFVGSCVTATGSGSNITVTVNCSEPGGLSPIEQVYSDFYSTINCGFNFRVGTCPVPTKPPVDERPPTCGSTNPIYWRGADNTAGRLPLPPAMCFDFPAGSQNDIFVLKIAGFGWTHPTTNSVVKIAYYAPSDTNVFYYDVPTLIRARYKFYTPGGPLFLTSAARADTYGEGAYNSTYVSGSDGDTYRVGTGGNSPDSRFDELLIYGTPNCINGFLQRRPYQLLKAQHKITNYSYAFNPNSFRTPHQFTIQFKIVRDNAGGGDPFIDTGNFPHLASIDYNYQWQPANEDGGSNFNNPYGY
jgi:hypothetical protein